MTAAVLFSDHFWGERHMGFSVMYQNAKQGQLAVKELAEFVKERVQLEEEHNKLLAKHLHKTATLTHAPHTFAAVWAVAREALERSGAAQSQLVHALHDLAKDVQRYGDELAKKCRRLKQQETFDAVNLMQTTTTCLQKAKETYASRCIEAERLRRDSASAKDCTKADAKAARARDEYKQYVDKYASVRDDFAAKLAQSADTFQAHENAFLASMTALLTAFAQHTHQCHSVSAQGAAELRYLVENADVASILARFAREKGTGTEQPEVVVFEEPDLSKALPSPPPADAVNNSSLVVSLANSHNAHNPAALKMMAPRPSSQLISLESPVDAPPTQPPEAPLQPPAPVTRPRLGIRLRRSKPSASTSSMPSTSTETPVVESAPPLPPPLLADADDSLDGAQTNGERQSNRFHELTAPAFEGAANFGQKMYSSLSTSAGIGLFKKKPKKEKKMKGAKSVSQTEIRPSDLTGVDETRSSASSNRTDENASAEIAVDDEGYSIRPMESKRLSRSSSSSQSDEDEESDRLNKVQRINIKPPSTADSSASIEQLRDAIGTMRGVGASMGDLAKSSTFDDAAWTPAANRSIAPMRPSLTGDPNLNKSLASDFFPPGGAIKPSNTGSHSRSRPRSNTPLEMIHIGGGFRPRSESSDFGDGSVLAARQAESGDCGGDAPVTTHVPVAFALTEHVNAWFRGSQNCRLKVSGSVAVSLPASAVPILCVEPADAAPLLSFRLVRSERLHAVIPNKQVLSAEAVSQFTSSESYNFSFDRRGLSAYLRRESGQRPDALFYNIEVLRYEVRNPTAPLMMLCFWKCDAQQTDFRLDYKLNADCPLEAPLLNLAFKTLVDGDVTELTAKPDGQWRKEDSTLVWRVTELSRHGAGGDSLKARLVVGQGPTTPAACHAQFSANDATLSGANVQLTTDAFRLSLLRRKVLSGRYLCDADSR